MERRRGALEGEGEAAPEPARGFQEADGAHSRPQATKGIHSLPESSNVIEVGVFFYSKVASDWPSVDLLEDLWSKVKLKVYQIPAHLVHRELRSATFEGKSH